MHGIREDPVIPVDRPVDAKGKQESGKPVPSLALLSNALSTPCGRFLPPPQGQYESLPHTILQSWIKSQK